MARRALAVAQRDLRAAGIRPTRQRAAVLAELTGEPDDATAQELHERLRRRGVPLGLATVYRTLRLFAAKGLVDTIAHHPDELCYRRCGDEHHHHLVCSGCHSVVEIDDCRLDPWLREISAKHGFVTTGHRFEVAGLCAACRP